MLPILTSSQFLLSSIAQAQDPQTVIDAIAALKQIYDMFAAGDDAVPDRSQEIVDKIDLISNRLNRLEPPLPGMEVRG